MSWNVLQQGKRGRTPGERRQNISCFRCQDHLHHISPLHPLFLLWTHPLPSPQYPSQFWSSWLKWSCISCRVFFFFFPFLGPWGGKELGAKGGGGGKLKFSKKKVLYRLYFSQLMLVPSSPTPPPFISITPAIMTWRRMTVRLRGSTLERPSLILLFVKKKKKNRCITDSWIWTVVWLLEGSLVFLLKGEFAPKCCLLVNLF